MLKKPDIAAFRSRLVALERQHMEMGDEIAALKRELEEADLPLKESRSTRAPPVATPAPVAAPALVAAPVAVSRSASAARELPVGREVSQRDLDARLTELKRFKAWDDAFVAWLYEVYQQMRGKKCWPQVRTQVAQKFGKTDREIAAHVAQCMGALGERLQRRRTAP